MAFSLGHFVCRNWFGANLLLLGGRCGSPCRGLWRPRRRHLTCRLLMAIECVHFSGCSGLSLSGLRLSGVLGGRRGLLLPTLGCQATFVATG